MKGGGGGIAFFNFFGGGGILVRGWIDFHFIPFLCIKPSSTRSERASWNKTFWVEHNRMIK